MPALAPSEKAWYQVRLAEQERRRKAKEADRKMQEIFKELEDHNIGLDTMEDVKPDEYIPPVIGTTQESTAPEYDDREVYLPSAQESLKNAIGYHFRNTMESQKRKNLLDTEVPKMMAKRKQVDQADRISKEAPQLHKGEKSSGTAKTPDTKSEDDESRVLSSLFWLMDRPQQSVFQGARAGADAFERDLHRGSNPLVAAARSVPSLLRGAAQGLVGSKPNVYGEQLTEGLSELHDGGEWGRATEQALANFINFTASPMDVAAPVGKALKIPWATYKNMTRAAPEFRAAWKGLGGPLKNLAKRIWGKALPTGDWRLDWLGRYGVHSSAPGHVDDIQPWIVQTKALDVQPVSNLLLDGPRKSDIPIGGIFYPLLNRTGKGVAPRRGNLLIQSLKTPLDLYHEGGHYLATMLDKHYTFQPLKNMKKAAEAVAERLPVLKARIDAGRFSPHMVFRRVTDRIPKLHSEAPNITRYLKGRGYDDFTNAELGHEILGHWIGNHFPLSEAARSPNIMREAKLLDNDPLLRAIKETTYSDLFLPPQVKDLRKLERAPTHVAAQTQRTIRHILRKRREEEKKKMRKN